MEDLFVGEIDEFIRYEKDTQGKKSKQDKKKQKIEKIRADLKDPQLRKQRHQIRRQQAKAKLQKQLEGMTEQQARIYLDSKKQVKAQVKERTLKALQTGMPILIDAVFEDRMNEKENKSLACQIQLIMKAIKHIQDPPGIHLCSVGGVFKSQLEKMRYQHWILKSNAQNILEVANKLNKNPIYLSPDASQQLKQIDPNAAYVIGGLVDRTVIKNASLNRAEQLGIPAVRLPIRQFMKSRICLNLDHVVMMLCKFKQVGDWKAAFDYGAPKRWKRDTEKGSKPQNKEQEKQEQQSLSQNENSEVKQQQTQQKHTTEKKQQINN